MTSMAGDRPPGRLLLHLRGDLVAKIQEAVPARRFHRQRRKIRNLGIDGLDSLLRESGVLGIRRLYGAHHQPLFGHFLLKLALERSPRRAAKILMGHAGVLSAEPERYRGILTPPAAPGPPVGRSLSEVCETIRWPAAFATDPTRRFPKIAVIDTGVQNPGHPLLQDAVVEQWDTVDVESTQPPGDFQWWTDDLDGPDQVAADELGHGTHVAGIVAGAEQGTFHGIAPGAELIAVRAVARVRSISSGALNAYGTSSNVAAAIQLAVDRGASVINLSIGFADHGSKAEKRAIDQAVAKGVIIVAAIGNDGPTGEDLFPARYRRVIAVGATDIAGKRWPKSQVGSNLCVMAPGVSIVSTGLNNTLVGDSGTSMACAVVSGVAALAKAKRPTLTAQEFRDLLVSTSRRAANVDHTEERGWGLIDAGAAIDAL